MNVSLTPELQRFVADKVQTGLYHTASEVVREGLRLLQERDELRRTRLEELRKQIAVGVEQADRGELVDGPAFFEKLQRKTRAGRERKG